jgi:glycosyltransferase involved in cell wall biosynthesis
MNRDAPIKLARIITRLDLSGPARHVCSLTSDLDPQQYKSWLICGRPNQNEHDGSSIAATAGVQPIYIDSLRRGFGWHDLNAGAAIKRLLGTIDPAIVATHTAKAGALGRAAGLWRSMVRRDRVRLVHTFHGHVFHHYFSSPVSRAFAAIERHLASVTDMIITVSPTVRRQLIEEYRIAGPEKVRIVPLGFDFIWRKKLVDERGWLRAKLGIRESTVLIGTVGRLAKIKNTAMILRAFAQMLRTEGIDAHLAVIGDGEQLENLQNLVRELLLEDRVTFCGWVLRRERIFSDLDLSCLSSQNEGTPVSIIESLAAGVPVVATRVGGVADVMRDPMDGELVECGDDDAMAAAFARVARGRRVISTGRSAAICQQYSTTRMVKDIEALYQEVLQNPRARREAANLEKTVSAVD